MTALGVRLMRRWPTVAALAVLTCLVVLDALRAFADGLAFAAVLYVAWAAVRGDLWRSRAGLAQLGGLAAFGAVAVLATVAGARAATYVLAAGWLAHAAWDAVHLRAGIVVPRWWSESCAVLDTALAVLLLGAAVLTDAFGVPGFSAVTGW